MKYIIISDTHIGDRQSNKNLPKLFSLLEKFADDNCTLVLNGDIFDFAKSLNFDERHRMFISIIKKFKEVIYVAGNHDWFISGLLDVVPKIKFQDDFLLKLNHKIIRVAHGHQTDLIATKLPRFNRFLIKLNSLIYDITGIDIQHYLKKTWVVQKFLLQKQENRLIRMEKIANVVIAGHTHNPCLKEKYGIKYYNTGDWVESNHPAYVIIDNDNIEFIKV